MKRRIIQDEDDEMMNSVNIKDESSNDSNGNVASQFRRLSIHNVMNETLLPLPSDIDTPILSEKEKKKQYNNLIRTARDLEKKGEDPVKFIHMFEQAYSLFSVDDKLSKKIEKYKRLLAERIFLEQTQMLQTETNQNIVKNEPIRTSFATNSSINLQIKEEKLILPTTPKSSREIPASSIISPFMSPQSEKTKRFEKLPNGFIYDKKADIYILMDAKSKQDRKIPFKLSSKIYNQLYDYQKEGLLWYWGKHISIRNDISGGILADDMVSFSNFTYSITQHFQFNFIGSWKNSNNNFIPVWTLLW